MCGENERELWYDSKVMSQMIERIRELLIQYMMVHFTNNSQVTQSAAQSILLFKEKNIRFPVLMSVNTFF